ncbi:MAG: tRNA preQ1(34) S-adenosylmethionine ribosyltransferase-isomerase QueA [Vicinamibacterales bacterium]
MRLSDFDFDLPEHLIAQQPRPRGQSRLLVVDRKSGTWTESRVSDLPAWLHPGDLLVANNSKVFPARLLGRRAGGGKAECLLLRPASEATAGEQEWWALVNPGARLPVGAAITFADGSRAPGIDLRGEIVARADDGSRRVRFVATGASVTDALDQLGHMPLPPYIRRPDTLEDRTRYQTMFARLQGSIAAPTAGLHFDEVLMASLVSHGVRHTTITLHVGYGTFKPVTVEDIAAHRVDAERFSIDADAAAEIQGARDRGSRVVAVGTTTTRALESVAQSGRSIVAGHGDTSLCIVPGYQFRCVDALMTNFHLPQSSLLLLVCAFAGRDLVLAAYQDAIARGFMFYSYGDAMLIT